MPRKPKAQPREYGDGSITYRAADKRALVIVRVDGRRKQIGSVKNDDRDEALRLAREILEQYRADLDAGLAPEARDWLTVDWLDEWLTTKEPRYDRKGNRIKGVEPTTFEKYEMQIRRHIVPYVGKILPASLTNFPKHARQIARWQDALNDAAVGVDTQLGALQRLSSALDLAVAHQLILFNPAANKALVERPRLPEREQVEPSELDLMRLMRAIDGDPLEALVWVALGGGFRRGEVAALEWADVSIFGPEGGIIRAHQRRNRLARRTQRRLNLPGDLKRPRLKTEKERSVDFRQLLVEILEQRWQHQLRDRAAAGSQWQGPQYDPARPTGYLFTSPLGRPMTVRAIDKYLERIRTQAGLDLDRFHALRRNFTTLLGKTGAPDRVTMKMAGHKTLAMTHYYQDPMASQTRAAAEALDAELRRLRAQARGQAEPSSASVS